MEDVAAREPAESPGGINPPWRESRTLLARLLGKMDTGGQLRVRRFSGGFSAVGEPGEPGADPLGKNVTRHIWPPRSYSQIRREGSPLARRPRDLHMKRRFGEKQ